MKTCPGCNKDFDPNQNSENLPFCSERCRMVDLGAWLTEKHRIADDEPGFADSNSENNQDKKKH